MSSQNTLISKDELVSYLTKGTVKLKFIKRDGSLREMNCTLYTPYLPEQTETSRSYTRHTDDVLSVWDLDANAWRSVVIPNITWYHPN